jgi:hypothetical protein
LSSSDIFPAGNSIISPSSIHDKSIAGERFSANRTDWAYGREQLRMRRAAKPFD